MKAGMVWFSVCFKGHRILYQENEKSQNVYYTFWENQIILVRFLRVNLFLEKTRLERFDNFLIKKILISQNVYYTFWEIKAGRVWQNSQNTVVVFWED